MKKFFIGMSTVALLSMGLAACSSEEASTTKETSAEPKTEETAKETSAVSKEAQIAEQFKTAFPSITEEQLQLNQTSYDFIVANAPLFPAKTDADIQKAKGMTDATITSKHLNKNAQPYFEKLATFQGTVISVEEQPMDNGETLSLTHVMDDNMQSYQVLMYKSTGDILEDDRVRFWGAPVGGSSFDNVSGGTTNVQNFAGSHIEKVQ